jgi:hypothetical protein
MFKQELPLMYPGDAEVKAVQAAMWDPFEYLSERRRDGLLKTEFPHPLGKVGYQVPCHGRVQNIGKRTEETHSVGCLRHGDKRSCCVLCLRHNCNVESNQGITKFDGRKRPPARRSCAACSAFLHMGWPPTGRSQSYWASVCPPKL